jgi:hypothetical protein
MGSIPMTSTVSVSNEELHIDFGLVGSNATFPKSYGMHTKNLD